MVYCTCSIKFQKCYFLAQKMQLSFPYIVYIHLVPTWQPLGDNCHRDNITRLDRKCSVSASFMLPFEVMPQNMSSAHKSSIHHIGVNYLILRLYSVHVIKYMPKFALCLSDSKVINLDIFFITYDTIILFSK
jgi:hypothetical protein